MPIFSRFSPSHSQRNHSTVIVHLPFSIKWKSDSFTIAPDCQRFPNTTDCLTGDLFQPRFMTMERPDVLHSLWTSHDMHMRVRRAGPHDVGSSRLMRGWQSGSLRIERPHDHPVWPHGDCRTGFVIGVRIAPLRSACEHVSDTRDRCWSVWVYGLWRRRTTATKQRLHTWAAPQSPWDFRACR